MVSKKIIFLGIAVIILGAIIVTVVKKEPTSLSEDQKKPAKPIPALTPTITETESKSNNTVSQAHPLGKKEIMNLLYEYKDAKYGRMDPKEVKKVKENYNKLLQQEEKQCLKLLLQILKDAVKDNSIDDYDREVLIEAAANFYPETSLGCELIIRELLDTQDEEFKICFEIILNKIDDCLTIAEKKKVFGSISHQLHKEILDHFDKKGSISYLDDTLFRFLVSGLENPEIDKWLWTFIQKQADSTSLLVSASAYLVYGGRQQIDRIVSLASQYFNDAEKFQALVSSLRLTGITRCSSDVYKTLYPYLLNKATQITKYKTIEMEKYIPEFALVLDSLQILSERQDPSAFTLVADMVRAESKTVKLWGVNYIRYYRDHKDAEQILREVLQSSKDESVLKLSLSSLVHLADENTVNYLQFLKQDVKFPGWGQKIDETIDAIKSHDDKCPQCFPLLLQK